MFLPIQIVGFLMWRLILESMENMEYRVILLTNFERDLHKIHCHVIFNLIVDLLKKKKKRKNKT